MKKNKSSENCPICGQYMDVVCSGHRDKPFVDGRCYDAICHSCFSVPCIWRFDEDVWMWMHYDLDQCELHTVAELMHMGFDKEESTNSLKAIKKAIKSCKKPK